MNELPASGWNEPNDELSFDLDREWERWNMELSDELTPEQQADQLRLLEQYEEIKLEALRKLHELDVVVVLDVDASKEAEQFTVFAETWQNNRVEEYKRLGRELTEADERQLAIDCVVAYFEERDFQALIINAVTMYHFIALNADRPEVKASALNMDTMKKELQSELLVHRNLPMTNAWQEFVSDMVPGESLDMFSKDDQVHLVKARLSTPDFVAEKVLKKSVIEQAFELTGIDWENDDLAMVVTTVADIMNMQIIAAQPVFNETERANRNAELWSEGRKLECDPEAVRKIIDLMDASYPVIAPPEL